MDGLNLAERAEPPSESPALPDLETLQREKEALRIQAAAVAAQQAALTEEEIKLGQRATALARQEAQLAEHLEAKRNRLAELQSQVGAARAALRKERAEFEEQSKSLLGEVEEQKTEADRIQQTAERERARFVWLRRRLKQRVRRHMAEREAGLQRREQQLERECLRLADEADRVQQDRDALRDEQLRCNAEIELNRRRIREDRSERDREASEWVRGRNREQAALREQANILSHREASLAEVERELVEEKQQWESERLYLRKEIEGLESRALNLRQKLIEQQVTQLPPREPLSATPSLNPPQAAVPPCEADLQFAATLERLAGDLVDQRVQIAEQFARFLHLEECRRVAYAEAIAELEAATHELELRDRALSKRQSGIENAEADLERSWEDLADNRSRLDAWHAQLSMREKAWESERSILIGQLLANEALTKRRLAELDDLRRKWKQARRQAGVETRRLHTEFVEARRLYAVLWEDCLRRSADLDYERRTLAEKTLTLEQYRLEIIGQAKDAATAERQIERLRRRWASLFHEAEQSLQSAQETLGAESRRVNDRSRRVEEDAAEFTRRAADLAERAMQWEDHQLHVDEANVRIRKELETLRAERSHQEQQIAGLRDEIERMAHTLLGPDLTLPQPISQAA
jgi:hypothetical protein